MKLSVIMPVFNEAKTIVEIVNRVRAVPIPHELVLVDDFSSDGSRELLDSLANAPDVRVLHHKVNRGKGVAVATGLNVAAGDVAVIQDADLEYDPGDFVSMLKPIQAGEADVVYGVRDLSSQRPVMRFGNRLMSAMTNVLYGTRLQDMETCYKMMTRVVFQMLELECKRFDVEAEITAKILRAGYAIHQLPINYTARYEDKKLSPLDGWPTLKALVKYRFKH
ncbi:MAG: glycosyltransferase family 2 protein [Anaerolineales bacterium]